MLAQIFDDADTEMPPTIEVWNKIDQFSASERSELKTHARATHPAPILISATTGEGLDDLIGAIANAAYSKRSLRRVDIPTSAGDLHAWLHAHCEVKAQKQPDPERIELDVLMSDEELDRFNAMRRETAGTENG